MKLNLGCGNVRQREGYVNIDSNPAMEPDICAEVPPIPVDDESVEHIYASHFLEHLTNEKVAELMAEVWRVLKTGKSAEFVVPYVLGHSAWQDPTHKSFYVWERFLYFTGHMSHLDYGYETRFVFRHPGPVQTTEEVRVQLTKTAEQEPCNCWACKRGPTNVEKRNNV